MDEMLGTQTNISPINPSSSATATDSHSFKTWSEVIGPLKEEKPFKRAMAFYDEQVSQGFTCYPPRNEIFNAFRLTDFANLKVIIIGQDPYHNKGQAMGLSFSVRPNVVVPPSLVNIYKELKKDIPSFTIPRHGCLVPWAKQGVLLLNSILTVREHKAMSHSGQGWEEFTSDVLYMINKYSEHNVYMLWGKKAQEKCYEVDRSKNLVLESAHPSPFSAKKFFGCRHFSQANEYLVAHGKTPIDWQLPEEIAPADLC